MYTLKIEYKGNDLFDQLSLRDTLEYIPTLEYESSFIKGITSTNLVVLGISKAMIKEIKDICPCMITITELLEGKSSTDINDFI